MIAKRVKVTTSLDPPAPELKTEYVTGKIYRGATKKFFSGNGKDKQSSPPEPKAEPKPKSDANQNKVPSTNPIRAPVNNGPYHCETCNRTLKSRAGYLSHMRSKLHARRSSINKSGPIAAPKVESQVQPKTEPKPEPEPQVQPKVESPKNNNLDFEEMFNKLYSEKESKRLAQKELRRKEKELQRKKQEEEKAARRKVKQEAYEQYKKLLSSENVQRLISGTKQPPTPKPVAELSPKPKAKPKPKPKPKAKPFERISDTRHKKYSEGDINFLTGRKVRLKTKLVRGRLIEYYE